MPWWIAARALPHTICKISKFIAAEITVLSAHSSAPRERRHCRSLGAFLIFRLLSGQSAALKPGKCPAYLLIQIVLTNHFV